MGNEVKLEPCPFCGGTTRALNPREALMYEALKELGRLPQMGAEVYCWCKIDRNDSLNPEMHSINCRTARAALAAAEGKDSQ